MYQELPNSTGQLGHEGRPHPPQNEELRLLGGYYSKLSRIPGFLVEETGG